MQALDVVLVNAPQCSSLSTLKHLIKKGADVNATDIHNDSVLMNACYYGRKNMVKYLLKHNANVNYISPNKQCALSHSLYKGHTKIIQLLLKHGVRSKGPNPQRGVDLNDQQRRLTLLQSACWGGYVGIIEILLPTIQDSGSGPLDIALLTRRIDIARILLKHGCMISPYLSDESRSLLNNIRKEEKREVAILGWRTSLNMDVASVIAKFL